MKPRAAQIALNHHTTQKWIETSPIKNEVDLKCNKMDEPQSTTCVIPSNESITNSINNYLKSNPKGEDVEDIMKDD